MVKRKPPQGQRGGGHDAAGGMRWLLTYADLITLLMVFFVVLYSMSVVDQQKYIALAATLRASLYGQKAGNAVLNTAKTPSLNPSTQPEDQNLASLGEKLAAEVQAEGLGTSVSITLTDRGLVVSFSAEAVFFEKASARLQPAFQTLLRNLAPLLKPVPNQMEVTGSTDDLPLHSPIYATAWELSAARATNVVRYLTEQGGLDPHKLRAVALGEWHPKYPNTNEANRARNRRVDLVILRHGLSNDEKVIRVILDATHGQTP